MDLQTPIKNAGRIYKMYAGRLEKLGIFKLEDFLYHIPFRYDDFSIISKISQIQSEETVTIRGTVEKIQNVYTRNHKTFQKAKVADDTGEIDVVWFNQPFLVKNIREGDSISLSGKVEKFGPKTTMQSPEYELTSESIHTGRLVPVYPETKGVSSKWMRRQVYKILNNCKLNEFLPPSVINDNNFFELGEAIKKIHFPENPEEVVKARARLAFDELLITQLKSLKRRADWKKKLKGNKFKTTRFEKQINEFFQKLPFELTSAQRKAVDEIFQDLSLEKPMNRLLEGDVGSGKTVVAAGAMYLASLNGFQSVLMAPTEILAQQHYRTISDLLSPFDIKVGLATGSSKYKVLSIKTKNKRNTHNTNYMIQATGILIGTHALLSKNIHLERLGLVVIDEQQRFGVEQRALIREKGTNPHFLTMTATPIPRTVALTMYGDLELSYLYEMPKGRKRVVTWLVPAEKRQAAYTWIKKQIRETQSQIFIVCPFIEESETMVTVKAAVKEFEKLKNEVFKGFKPGLLHGKMKSDEKNKILKEFRDKKIDILVATPVVEVGIDFPNATVMMIEGAERFGLSQLHQMRGRVGRGEKKSYCLLFTEIQTERAIERLKTMERIYDGAELAEADLKFRGPGEISGTMQHGAPLLKIASFSDFAMIKKTKTEAEKLFIDLSKYPKLEEKIEEITLKKVSPD